MNVVLRGNPRRPWGPTTKIEVQGRIRYPDAPVSCTPAASSATIIPEPVVVFKMLSTDTSRTDRIDNVRKYQATPFIQRYVILEQSSIGATAGPEGWAACVLTDGHRLRMPEIGAEVALADIYTDVSFPPEEGASPS